MDQLQALRDKLHEAQGWCDHNGDHGTGFVCISVDTLQYWENEVVGIIDYLDNLFEHYGEEWTPDGDA